MLYYENTWFISSSIAVISLLEWIMMFVEVGVYRYYGFTINAVIAGILGILLNTVINVVGVLVIYLKFMRRNPSVESNLKEHKRAHVCLLIISLLFSNRMMKMMYSNFANQSSLCGMEQMFNDKKVKKAYLIFSYVSLAPSVILALNAIYNMTISVPTNVTLTIQLDAERILISTLIIILIIIEFIIPSKKPLWV